MRKLECCISTLCRYTPYQASPTGNHEAQNLKSARLTRIPRRHVAFSHIRNLGPPNFPTPSPGFRVYFPFSLSAELLSAFLQRPSEFSSDQVADPVEDAKLIKGLYWEPQTGKLRNIVGI